MLSFLIMSLSLAFSGPVYATTEKALFAGGCFWCMEPPFDMVEGVIKTTSGYAGGSAADAKYETVSSGRTSHKEVLEVEYDPQRVSYEALLEVYWKNIDPYDGKGQFCDKGTQYQSGIFALNAAQKAAAVKSLIDKSKFLKQQAIATRVLPTAIFYPAEDYHQDYYKKNPIRYKYYRASCGRDKRLKEVWGD